MAEGSRGPIKVGTGYVEIIPQVLQKDVEELRRKVQKEMQALGTKAAKDISEGAKKGLAALPGEVDKAAKKANDNTKKRKKESAKDLKRIEEQITREYGEEAAKRWRAFRDLEQKKEKSLKRASSATKAALRETVRQEEQATRQRQAAAERLEKDRLRLMRQTATDHARLEMQKTRLEQAQERLRIQALREANRTREIEMREASRIRVATMQQETARYRAELQQQTAAQRMALRAQVQAQQSAVRAQVAALREQAAAQRAVLQDGIAFQQRHMTALRDQIRDVNRNINSTNTTTQSYFTKTGTALRRMGTWFDQVGMSINEAANILTTRFLAPLAGAGAALTAIGVESGDKRMLGQLGLGSAGVSKSVSAAQMEAIQEYAINTPYSIDVMHEYQMKLIRSVAGTDKNWYSTNASTRTGAANKAAETTTDLIMAIGDSMARAGNLNPMQFQRAMYAMDMIMDMDRAPTKNVKQLAAASGMPASELAHLLGFKNSTEMWKVIGTPAKDGGGVTGRQIMDAMLNYWNPGKYDGSQKSGGSQGFASKMTSETITGRLQQMKEQAVFGLSELFVQPGKDGSYSYTPLGTRIMGKRVPVMKRDRFGELTATGEYTTEGGILNQVKDLAEKWAPKIDDFLNMFLDGVETFVSTLDRAATWIEESGLGDLVKPITEFLLEWGPLILAVGLLSKVLGKAVGMVGRLFTPAAALTRAGVRAYEGGRDVRSQRQAARDARNEARDNGGSRREVRQAGRDAYMRQRTENRAGDSRSNTRRLLDGFMGRDSRQQDGQRQIRALEDQIREARDEATNLRDELRDLNRESMRQITQALAGNGTGSVQGAANQAGSAVNAVQTQARQANSTSLGQLHQELEKVKKSSQELGSELGKAHGKANTLNGAKLDNVTTEFAQLKTAAEDAGKQITSDNTRVNNLNGKRVDGVTGSIDGLRDAAKRAADQIGDGAMASSTSGRTANLNKRRLTDVIAEFNKLTSAADKAYDKVGMGTGAGSLAGRIGLLNGRSLSKITDAVKDLKSALDGADKEADSLDNALESIGGRSPGNGGGGNGSSRNRNGRARGGVMRQSDVSFAGVLPGYSPWVDNIPAILSPGEAVLRPEVTNALGSETINNWNALAIRGKISRHARGTSGGGNGTSLESIRELIDLQNIAPVGTAMLRTMKLDGSSDPLGGSVQGGILRTGDHSAGIGGSVAAAKFRGMYDWMTEDVYELLKKVPSGVGQLAGVLGGSLSPVLGDYFWNDVWKGSGNIVDRGQRYMGHVFSTETVAKVWENLFSGVTDSAGAIWDTVTDPFGAISDAFEDVGGILSGSYNNLIGMVQTVKEVKDSPMAYAGRVFNGVMANAQESMPNTKGLFDFNNGSRVTANIPDLAKMIIEPGSGSGVQRWAPVAAQALSMLGLPANALSLVLHRIGVESGGNPNIVNKWDSNWEMGHPSVGLMQVIGPTYQRWAGPFKKTGPFLYGTSVNPLANIYAGLNYARNRYGSGWQKALSGNKGYASGTISASPGLAMVGEKGRELVAFGGGERVFNNEETEGILNGKKYEIHVHEARMEPTPQAVLRALQTAEALYL